MAAATVVDRITPLTVPCTYYETSVNYTELVKERRELRTITTLSDRLKA